MTAKRKKDTSFSKHRKCRLTDASCLSMPVQSLFTKLLNSLVCNFPEFRALKMAYFAVILHQCEDERITSNGIEYRYRLPPTTQAMSLYTHWQWSGKLRNTRGFLKPAYKKALESNVLSTSSLPERANPWKFYNGGIFFPIFFGGGGVWTLCHPKYRIGSTHLAPKSHLWRVHELTLSST